MLGARHPPLCCGPSGCDPDSGAGLVIAVKAARTRPILRQKGTRDDARRQHPPLPRQRYRTVHAASPTAHLLDELALYGYRPGQNEPDPRPLPEPDTACHHLETVVEALDAMLTGSRLEDDLADLLWSFANLFHRKIDRVEAELDRNEQAQRRAQAEQDGSEVKSVELERLIAQGLSLIERRNAFEFLREHAAELFEIETGSAWRPRTGSMVNHRALTASDHRQPRIHRRPPPRRYRSAGPRRHPHRLHRRHRLQRSPRIWDALDKLRAKHPDMVLFHGGSPRGAERIAACWADNRKVAAGRLQARLDPGRPRRTLQAQRPDARSAADRRRRISRLRHLRQPRRQGEEARHPSVALRWRTASLRRRFSPRS